MRQAEYSLKQKSASTIAGALLINIELSFLNLQ